MGWPFLFFQTHNYLPFDLPDLLRPLQRREGGLRGELVKLNPGGY
jgi:hypothetical protein